MSGGRSQERQRGTASVELVAVLPFLVVALAAAAQLAMVGHSLWSAGVAARAGARAALVGGEAAAAARASLPPLVRSGSVVRERRGVLVRVPVPRLLPGIPEISVEAGTELDGGG